MKYLRAALRLAVGLAALPLFVTLVTAQAFIVGPLFRNQHTIPGLLYNGLRRLFGLNVVFNKASAPIEKNKRTWFVANHMSMVDFITLGSVIDGTFAGKGDILKWPIAAQMARAVKYIGLRRSTEYNAQSRGKILANFNAGLNTIMFPEGTTNDGKKVYLFRAALLTALYGASGANKEGNDIMLKQDVVVQPVAIRIAEVSGEDAIGNDALRNLYSMPHEHNTLVRIWKRLMIQEIKVELTAFPPLAPADYSDAKALINKAATDIASVVNPGQTEFEKANIPVKKA